MIRDFLRSISYPFRDPNVKSRFGPIFLISFVPVVGLFALIGWQFSVIRHFGKGHHSLPPLDPAEIAKAGIAIFFFATFLTFIPPTILSILGVSGLGGLIDDIQVYSTLSFTEIATDWIEDAAKQFVVMLIWAVIASPLVYSSIVRSAVRNNLKSLWNVPLNFLFLIRHSMSFIKFYIYGIFLAVFIFCVDVVISFTGLGLLVVPFVSAWLYFIMTSYELGHLAEKVSRGKAAKYTVTELELKGGGTLSLNTDSAVHDRD